MVTQPESNNVCILKKTYPEKIQFWYEHRAYGQAGLKETELKYLQASPKERISQNAAHVRTKAECTVQDNIHRRSLKYTGNVEFGLDWLLVQFLHQYIEAAFDNGSHFF